MYLCVSCPLLTCMNFYM
uniref:Uncharacterized protein n=1 Tax=Anguilla anguilla TaxID=7936 RepID=A0A0E9PZG3_ANGAN